ncbi:lactococcin 972 family bacteriocin [Sphingomonas sp. LR61]|uniref:lactococcin 972 family bacteriocin n=1 Tax=Sphingomonas sp. LR61 TaxID=3050234 RepID=UPI002FE0B154
MRPDPDPPIDCRTCCASRTSVHQSASCRLFRGRGGGRRGHDALVGFSVRAGIERRHRRGSAEISGTGDTQVIIDDTDPAQILTTKKVGGGTWIYGTGGGNSYSYYDHKTKKHSSTACSGYGTSCRGSGWVAKEKRSVAKVLKTAWGNTAFWNTK